MEGYRGAREFAWEPREGEVWTGAGEDWTGAALVLC